MLDYNLLISTARDFEGQAECELWFLLVAFGDETPIISKVGISGLLVARTHSDPRGFIDFLRKIMTEKDTNYFQFVQKIYPIDKTVASDIPSIKEMALELIKTHPLCRNPESTYRITIRKRNTPLKTEDIITEIAAVIPYKVDLKQYNWNLEIEIIGDYTGLAIITEENIFKPISEQRTLLARNFEEN